ncbi:hypothetical protein HK100_012285 [Physocladia obscura]|uniref:Protein kinase domain-containing protein n=1 Tax=Physocladia obscura TaxID=109957 RepID=A0AAD5T007_9FUNG|nr:hypothetical protein HK100_012285 [Physocladia obscura]
MFICLDFKSGGNLRFTLNKLQSLPESACKYIIGDISRGINYLHLNHIVHRNLRPENILLDDNGRASLTGFNLATNFNEKDLLYEVAGTVAYMGDPHIKVSPEFQHLVKRLLQSHSPDRLGDAESGGFTGFKAHRWFDDYDWKITEAVNIKADYIPELATSNFFDAKIPVQEENLVDLISKRISRISISQRHAANAINFNQEFRDFNYEQMSQFDDRGKKWQVWMKKTVENPKNPKSISGVSLYSANGTEVGVTSEWSNSARASSVISNTASKDSNSLEEKL